MNSTGTCVARRRLRRRESETEDHPLHLTPPQARRLGYLSTPELMDLIVDDPEQLRHVGRTRNPELNEPEEG